LTRRTRTTRRQRRQEDGSSHDAWAIPYADLLTLLLAFFVVMYAISSVNEGKYRVLSDSLFAAFRGTPRTMEPIQVGEKQVGSGADIHTSIVQQALLEGQPRSLLAPVPVESGVPKATGDSRIVPKLPPRAAAAAAALSRVADEVEHAMDDLVKQNLVVVRRTDFWIEVEIRTDILFPSGSAQLAPYAVDVIERLGGVLGPFPNPVRVEGHTDNVPIKTVAFYSNWELSAARAGSVVRVLAGRGIAPARLAVIGFGEQRPVQTNDTAQGRNANRRVVIVILSTELTRHNDPTELPAPPGSAPTAPGPADDTTPKPLAPVSSSPVQVTTASVPSAQFPSVPTPLAQAAHSPAALTQIIVHAAGDALNGAESVKITGMVPAP
jgi:chemotaxis protein MotB